MESLFLILELFGGLIVLITICTMLGNLLKLNDFLKKKK